MGTNTRFEGDGRQDIGEVLDRSIDVGAAMRIRSTGASGGLEQDVRECQVTICMT